MRYYINNEKQKELFTSERANKMLTPENEEKFFKDLLKKVKAAKDAKELFSLVENSDPEGRYYGYEGCDTGLYLPYLECEIPMDKYDIFAYLKKLDKEPEIPAILQDEDGDLIFDKNYTNKLYYERLEAYEDGEIEDDVEEAEGAFWETVGDAYQWSDTEGKVDALCMWEHKDEMIDAIKDKIEKTNAKNSSL